MKKLLTLLIAVAAFASAHAQTDRDEARRVVLGQPKGTSSTSKSGRDVILGGDNRTNYPNTYPSGSRREQIDAVNREYDAKITAVRNNKLLSAEQKARMIRQLEQERASKIRQINQSSGGVYTKKRNRDYDDDDYGKKNGKSNNGKHLGWEKGKGNPHKNGGKPGKGKG